jgi:hypothetical protein
MIKLISLFKDIILEGGNVFGTTHRIKKEDIPPTLDKFVEELGRIFPNKKDTFEFQTLGSVGQKADSGDIDLAYKGSNLLKDGEPDLEGWDINPNDFQKLYDTIRGRAKSATEEQSTKRAMLELIAQKVIDKEGPIKADTKSAGNGSLFFEFPQYNAAGKQLENKYVQIDINVGDPEWLKFSYFSKGYIGNIKGLHRTQLLVALFTNKGLSFNHNQGVKDKGGKILAKNPQQVLDLLNEIYGIDISQDIIYDYSELMKYLEENLSEQELHSIYDIYLKILDRTRADIPEHLQDYWIKNQQRLGLKGTYLPTGEKEGEEPSKLLNYKTA